MGEEKGGDYCETALEEAECMGWMIMDQDIICDECYKGIKDGR